MNKKTLLAIASLALILTGFSVQKSFQSPPPAPTTSTAAADPYSSDAALRHYRCQPRHWRALVLCK